jgi:outer membrane protein OmpA-like peptidoglycan-associated protein
LIDTPPHHVFWSDARGVASASIVAVGRGKREPLIPTADGVAEPRNRRVEIVVR